MTTEQPAKSTGQHPVASEPMDVDTHDTTDAGDEGNNEPRHKELERRGSEAKEMEVDNRKEKARERKEERVIDREKTCPFLVRMFVNTKGEYRMEDLEKNGLPTEDEYALHTWTDASLRELASVLTARYPEASPRMTRISFRCIIRTSMYPARFRTVHLGVVYNYKSTIDDSKTLDNLRFITGDGILVSIVPHEPMRNNSHDISASRSGSKNLGEMLGDLRRPREPSHPLDRIARFEPYSRPRAFVDHRRVSRGFRADNEFMERDRGRRRDERGYGRERSNEGDRRGSGR